MKREGNAGARGSRNGLPTSTLALRHHRSRSPRQRRCRRPKRGHGCPRNPPWMAPAGNHCCRRMDAATGGLCVRVRVEGYGRRRRPPSVGLSLATWMRRPLGHGWPTTPWMAFRGLAWMPIAAKIKIVWRQDAGTPQRRSRLERLAVRRSAVLLRTGLAGSACAVLPAPAAASRRRLVHRS